MVETEANSRNQAQVSRLPAKLSLMILIGLGLGIFCGLFFGEYCEGLKVVGDIYIGFLRMTVLPYIAITLIANLGRLTLVDSRRLARVGGSLLLLFWLIGLGMVFVLSNTFPDRAEGSFFSSSLTDPPKQTNFFEALIPSNVFSALANDQVPAVILLCLAGGIALSRSDRRKVLIEQLDILSEVLMRVTKFIVRLTPIAIFAIAASTVGTLSLEQAMRLQVYFVAYTFGAILLGGVILPLLVTSFTPIRYGELIWACRDSLLTAFVTGKLIIVLPLMIEQTEALLKRHRSDERAGTTADVLFPLAYPFPHVGKLLRMLFVPFAAWFLGSPLEWRDFPGFLGVGLVSYFGGPIVATPFLLDWAQLPHDMFQLFLFAGVYGERVGDALGVMHLVCFSLLTTCIMQGMAKFSLRGLLRFAGVTVGCVVVALVGLQSTINYGLSPGETKSEVLAKMQLLEEPVVATIVDEPEPNPFPLMENESLLERIRRRGVIRVGFTPDALPFSYFNEHGELVGFDINLIHALARDLKVQLEFVYYDRDNLTQDLNADHFDIAVSKIIGTIERSEEMQHTPPYLDVNLALVVADYRSRRFRSLEELRSMRNLRIGVVDREGGFDSYLAKALPNAELVYLDKSLDFFVNQDLDLDALLTSAESGSAYTILYPSYEVVIPSGVQDKLPLFIAIGQRDVAMREYLEHWLLLRKDDGTIDSYYDHWILGENHENKSPRWSIMRNVLGWVK